MVNKGGVLATTVQPIDESAAKQAGIRGIHFMTKRSASDLVELAKLVDQGVVKPRVSPDDGFGSCSSKEAQQLNETGRSHGKFILKVA